MTKYLILVRNPQRGGVLAIREDNEEIALFDTIEAAEKMAATVPVCQAWPSSIVEAP
jgi:hypothetical protein